MIGRNDLKFGSKIEALGSFKNWLKSKGLLGLFYIGIGSASFLSLLWVSINVFK